MAPLLHRACVGVSVSVNASRGFSLSLPLAVSLNRSLTSSHHSLLRTQWTCHPRTRYIPILSSSRTMSSSSSPPSRSVSGSVAPAPAPASSDSASRPRGALIVLEGLDRSGKSSQCKRLVEALNASSPDTARLMRFPDRETAIGKMIDAYLRQSTEIDDHAIHLLFSANRWEKASSMLDALRHGTHLIVDRYAYSGIAFSCSKVAPSDSINSSSSSSSSASHSSSTTQPRRLIDLDWASAPDRGLPAPDLVLFLDVDSSTAESRGQYGEERYEKRDIQERVKTGFMQLMAAAASTLTEGNSDADHAAVAFGRGVRWHVIDANQTMGKVQQDIMTHVNDTIQRVQNENDPVKLL